MDLFVSKLLLLLALIGCSAGQTIPTVDAVLGGSVTLNSAAPVPPYTVLFWTFSDGVNKPVNIVTVTGGTPKVHTSYAARAAVNVSSGSLTLNPLSSGDSGDYTLTVLPTVGDSTTDEVKLRVLVPISDVVITSNLSELIEYNSTVALNCSAKGSLLRFDWFNGSDPLVLDAGRMALTKGRAFSALSITGVLRTDLTRSVSCEASNSLQRMRSGAFNLTVFYGPDPVALSPPTVAPFISSSSSFNLSCWTTSSPPATLSWFHNQLPVAGAGSVLTLQTLRDNGLGAALDNYTCVASNAKTQRSAVSTVVSFAVMDPVAGARLIGPNATLLAGNSTANLSCQALGRVATREWSKDGKALLAGPRLTLSGDGSWLLISPVQKDDNGEFQCNLSNAVSSGSGRYRMVVSFGPEQAKVSGPSKVEENHAVTLSCSSASVPAASFTWKHNGSATGSSSDTLTIPTPQLKDSGTYTCEAFNPVTGSTSACTHVLQVKAQGTLDGLSDGAIAGIVVGILVAIGAAVAVTIYCRQKIPVESPY
ncbi:carcinoembryonic antigen-related cell adhesion molecule 20-like [Betta splendens]|uniref:Carcinoembryonic antigen-related cell adhesion molecule 20-like n=1 Tax=Betta splendens TaxID=158456 RepID=A0A6P7P1T7_BETSP|nr:carcinoembryonic antigen-related cell adhesion molecule 20-like [Betta splendens]